MRPSLVVSATLALSTSIVVDRPARADPAASAVAPETERHWYGLPMVVGYAASDALLVGAFVAGGNDQTALAVTLAIAGGAGHLLVGPLVHVAHGNKGEAAQSFFYALGGALLGFAAPVLGRGCDSHHHCPTGKQPPLTGTDFEIGAWVGAALGNVLDLVMNPYEYRGARPRSLWLTPRAGRGGFGLDLGGRF